MWHESLSSRIPVPRGERLVGIRLSSRPPVLLFSCYLPTRSGCTDLFKSVLDELDSCFTLYVGEILLFAGDFNADPGLLVDSFCRPANEQGIILNRYLSRWDYVSVPLLPRFLPVDLWLRLFLTSAMRTARLHVLTIFSVLDPFPFTLCRACLT